MSNLPSTLARPDIKRKCEDLRRRKWSHKMNKLHGNMMGATPFAKMIVNQEIRQQELRDSQRVRRITRDSQQRALENFRMPLSTERKTRVKKKRVRFPQKLKQLVTEIHIPTATQEESAILWYSTVELDRIQEQADANCLRAMKRHQGCKRFLDHVFLDSRHARQHHLNCWCRYSENLRGFEHIVNKNHSVERYVQKSINIQSVLVAQRDCKDQAKMSATLARISERSSKRAREFATALGEADEYAETLDRKSQLAVI